MDTGLFGGFPGNAVVKNLSTNVGDLRLGFNPWVGKVFYEHAAELYYGDKGAIGATPNS